MAITEQIDSGLVAKYDAAARDWQGKISKQGYPAAYHGLCQAALGNSDVSKWQVLDAGSGGGAFSQALINATGVPACIDLVDISAQMLDTAKDALAVFGVKTTATKSSIEGIATVEKYDLILCAHVLEHCLDPDKALANLRRSLNPGGRILLVVSKPHWCTMLIQMIWRNKTYRISQMRRLLGRGGFENVSIHKFASGIPSRTSCGYAAQSL